MPHSVVIDIVFAEEKYRLGVQRAPVWARRTDGREWNTMSFMRGVVENAVRNMSPDERLQAIDSLMQSVVRSMTPEERERALEIVVRHLVGGLSAEQRLRVADAAATPPATT